MSQIKCNLSNYLKRRGITSYRLAKNIGVHNSVLTRLANGETDSISFDVAAKICTGLEIGIGDLFEIEGIQRKPIQDELLIAKESYIKELHNFQEERFKDVVTAIKKAQAEIATLSMVAIATQTAKAEIMILDMTELINTSASN